MVNDSNNFFVSGSSDNTVKAWDLRMNKCMFTSVSHEDSVFAVAISNDNKLLIPPAVIIMSFKQQCQMVKVLLLVKLRGVKM